MLKIYLRLLLEEYLEEIDLENALNLVRMDVDDFLDEILEEIRVERQFFWYVWMVGGEK